jgi:hypothetical protein
MKLQWTSHFARAYGKAPKEIQAAFDKQSFLLLQLCVTRRSGQKNTMRAWAAGRRG